jgi:hypothetical protein
VQDLAGCALLDLRRLDDDVGSKQAVVRLIAPLPGSGMMVCTEPLPKERVPPLGGNGAARSNTAQPAFGEIVDRIAAPPTAGSTTPKSSSGASKLRRLSSTLGHWD